MLIKKRVPALALLILFALFVVVSTSVVVFAEHSHNDYNQNCHNSKDNDDRDVSPSSTPSATPTPEEHHEDQSDGQSDGGSSNPDATKAPVCSDGNTIQLPANVHVLRNGSDATVNFFITEGDSANIYVRVSGQADWNNAVTSAIDVKPNGEKFVSYTFHNLDANTSYDFGVQQKQGCGGGQTVLAVVVDGTATELFQFTYWEWAK